MGQLLHWLDRHLNREADASGTRRAMGIVAVLALVTGSVLPAWVVSDLVRTVLPDAVAYAALAAVASSALAQRSLDAHVRAVADALDREGLTAARLAVGQIVGRNTSALDEAGVSRAAIESLAENFADGVVAPAFWLALLGLPGAFAYKAINTADSMIGHRTPRHEAFGFCAAKVDDGANLVPARLAALLLAAAAPAGGSMRDAWRIMLRDARGHPSPNAGWPEAAMAGALGVRLGGPRAYGDRQVDDAFIGDPLRRPDVNAIRAALRIYRVACLLQIIGVAGLAFLTALWR